MHPLIPPFQTALLQNDLATAEVLMKQAQNTAKTSGDAEDKAAACEMEGGLLRARADYSRAVAAYEKALEFYKEAGNTAACALVTVQLAGVYYFRNQMRQCIGLCQRAVALAEPVQQTQALANAYQLMGLAQTGTGDLAASINNSLWAIELNRQLGNAEKEASAMMNLSIAYLRIGDYEKAMEQVLQSVRIFEELKQPLAVASCLISVGNILKERAQYERALDYYRQARDMNQALGNTLNHYYAQFNVSIVLHSLKRYNEALVETEKALQLILHPHRPAERCRVHLGMASIYMDTDRLAEAEEQCMLALQLVNEVDDARMQAFVKGVLGTLYVKCKRYAEAKIVLNEALAFVTEKELWPDAAECQTHLYEIAEAEGDTVAALHHYRQRTEIQQRLLDEKIQQRLLLLQVQFDTERKDTELEKLRAEKAALMELRQRNGSSYRLTPREHAILKLLVDGMSYKQISAELGIAYDTVREHIANLYKKLKVGTNTEAVAKAVKEGLV